ncbi:MAG: hypothetical protein PHP50_12980 [Lachnospiraceae bacterium]|nr:hypothetical protein [Lachnospiraceae bacterium]
MSAVILFIIFILIKNQTSADTQRSDMFKWCIFIYVGFSFLSVLIYSPLTWFAIFGVVFYILYRKRKNGDFQRWERDANNWKQHSDWSADYESTREKWHNLQNDHVKSRILPKPIGKRTKIVENFNHKYTLCLTDDEVKRIVDASYMSQGWKKEVEAMSAKYATVYEWFQGYTKWLRAYLYVFKVQNVTSDFEQQEKVVEDTFEQVFDFADTLENLSLDQKIERVNSCFLTGFDHETFMIAYRFLESKGRFHELETIDLVTNHEAFDEMQEKYQKES